MNLQFLQIGQLNGVSVAFFLNRDSMRVCAFPIDDYSRNSQAPRPDSRTVPFNYPPAPVPMPVYENPYPQPKAEYPDKPKSIIPPGIASLMKPDGPPPVL